MDYVYEKHLQLGLVQIKTDLSLVSIFYRFFQCNFLYDMLHRHFYISLAQVITYLENLAKATLVRKKYPVFMK
jgi:hypothetical protein